MKPQQREPHRLKYVSDNYHAIIYNIHKHSYPILTCRESAAVDISSAQTATTEFNGLVYDAVYEDIDEKLSGKNISKYADKNLATGEKNSDPDYI